MILPYLQNIDREYYNRYTGFNLPYLNELKIFLVNPMPMPEDTFVKNILAKDEVDEFKVAPGKIPKKLHSALTDLIDQLYFYNEEENAMVNSVITYLSMSMNPDLAYIHSKLAPLQEIHSKLIDLEVGSDGLTVFAKFLYNRSRMMGLQSFHGLRPAELELTTGFDKLVDAKQLAKMLARMNNIHSALNALRLELPPPRFGGKDQPIYEMINEITVAMLAYRKSLIAPEKAGLGDVDLAASEAVLWKQDPTPAADDNLMTTIKKYDEMELPFTPADFLLSLNEGVRLSGINLMV
jgi:hypothetical protein